MNEQPNEPLEPVAADDPKPDGQPDPPKKPGLSGADGCAIFFALALLLFGVMALFSRFDNEPTVNLKTQDDAARTRAAENADDPYAFFQTVHNTCGACGTSSPVGGWEAEDGRSLVLNDDGSFTAFFTDGTRARGEWTQPNDVLCLSPTGGGETCMRYRQRVDAMLLDEAIYIRR